MIVDKRKNTPAKKKPAVKKSAVKKAPVQEPAAQAQPEQANLVAPLDQKAFQFAISIIDLAPMTGADAGNVILLKQELARAAGMQAQRPPQ